MYDLGATDRLRFVVYEGLGWILLSIMLSDRDAGTKWEFTKS